VVKDTFAGKRIAFFEIKVVWRVTKARFAMKRQARGVRAKSTLKAETAFGVLYEIISKF
jgi:hypothetical protein